MAAGRAFRARSGAVTLEGEVTGGGPLVVLLHGLTATRRYVLMGSRLLARSGYRVAAYDARGHGESAPAETRDAYEYAALVEDLAAVLDELGGGPAVLAGNSMGAHTAVALALAAPERVSALVQITPAYDGAPRARPEELAEWDRLADGLEHGGVEGFLAAWRPAVEERFLETVRTVARQRLERHRHPRAVADALRVVPRSSAFAGLGALERVSVPALVVGSRDEADPGHPLAVAESYAERLPDCELVVEEPGRSPLAWQGAQLSRAIAAFLARRELGPRPAGGGAQA